MRFHPSAVASVAPISKRGACKAELASEEKGRETASGREACRDAFMINGSPEDYRDQVAALMSPVAHPSLDDLVMGAFLADTTVRQKPNQPWGYLARCDIARKMGSADTLEACLADLKRLSPIHPATTQGMTFAADRFSFLAWLLRVSVLGAVLGTLAHALLRGWRERANSRGAKRGSALALMILVGLLAGGRAPRVAHAEDVYHRGQLSTFKIDDSNPEASVPSLEQQTKDPLQFGYFVQDLGGKAEQAAKAGDHAAEARYYGALAKATPGAAFGPRKMCRALQAAGDVAKAVQACRTVLLREGETADDYVYFVQLVLSQKGRLPPMEEKELRAVIAHLAGASQLGTLPAMLRCDVALRFSDGPELEACAAELSKTAPNDQKTLVFQWALAVQNHDSAQAKRLIDRARTVGMSYEGIERMEAGMAEMSRRRILHLAGLGLAGALVAALLIFALRYLASRRQLATREAA